MMNAEKIASEILEILSHKIHDGAIDWPERITIESIAEAAGMIANEIRTAQREAMQECALLVEHTALPIDKQVQKWRERESTKKLGNLSYDEEVAFCLADLCADKIRALIEELGKE